MKSLEMPELPDSIDEVTTAERLRRSPLTDPRALVSSLVIHLALLTIASVLALQWRPLAQSRPRAGPCKANWSRPTTGPRPSLAAGARGNRMARRSPSPPIPGFPLLRLDDPAADALLSEILPTRDSAEVSPETLPGPSTSRLGMATASGPGELGGQGGGSGGGTGTGDRPGTEFFGMRDKGGSFAYVIDCSGSMTARGSLDVAKRELLSSLAQISPDARFAVVFYNLDAQVFTDPAGRPGLMAANSTNKARVRTLLSTVRPDGGTDHMLALKTAFAFRPEVIFFLTDADLITRQDVAELLAEVGKTRIQAIEFGQVSGLGGSAPLKSLAKATGGSYRYIDVNTFAR